MKLMLLCLLTSLVWAAPASPFKYYAGNYVIQDYQCLRNTCPKLKNDTVLITANEAFIGGVILVEFKVYSEGEDEYWQVGELFEREEWAMYSERGFYVSQTFKLTDNLNGNYTLEQNISGKGTFHHFEIKMVKR